MVYDVIVVGAGVMGSATAYALAKRGKKTLLLEQFPLPHTRGSSHGGSRITRKAYFEQFNSNIMSVAFPMWEELEKETGMELYRKTGMLVFSQERHMVSSYLKTLQSHSTTPVPLMDAATLSQKYPAIKFYTGDQGCLDESAGILYASKCLRAFQKVFEKHGGELADNHEVRHITPGDIITVHTDKGDFRSKGVVLTCGPWSSQVLNSLDIKLPLQTETIQVCYWKIRPGVDFSSVPCFISEGKTSHTYGLPPDEYPNTVKICLHRGRLCSPDVRDQVNADDETEDLDELKRFVTRVFPGVIPEPAIKERCMYTTTPDDVCVLDLHPKYKNIVYGAGFSGQGFKQAPVIGAMLADLVLQGKTSKLLVDEMRAHRFSKKSNL